MPSLQVSFAQPPASHSVSVSLVIFAVVPVVSTSQGLDFATHVVLAADSHAPPILHAAAPSPLRI
jgi:hypothetical protein